MTRLDAEIELMVVLSFVLMQRHFSLGRSPAVVDMNPIHATLFVLIRSDA
jgi:hypothetical protein